MRVNFMLGFNVAMLLSGVSALGVLSNLDMIGRIDWLSVSTSSAGFRNHTTVDNGQTNTRWIARAFRQPGMPNFRLPAYSHLRLFHPHVPYHIRLSRSAIDATKKLRSGIPSWLNYYRSKTHDVMVSSGCHETQGGRQVEWTRCRSLELHAEATDPLIFPRHLLVRIFGR